MTPDEFRKHGHEVIDWIADYWRRVESLPVESRVAPGEVYGQLPERAPVEGEPFEAMMADLDRIVMPGITHWQSPRFFGFFPANVSGPSVLGELLAAGLGVQGMNWATSPACTELEMRVLDWLVDMLALPGHFKTGSRGGGVIQDTASSATLCALLAAREQITGGAINRHGVDRPMRVYSSNEAHSSVEKAVRIAGLGSESLVQVDVDERFAMDPAALEAAIEADRAAGATPCIVCATVGTTSCNGMDPLRPIGDLCRRFGLWLHVDAAMSGTAALCPEFRFIHDGLEHADSYCFNPHKWMFTNFDCDCFYVRDREALIRAMSISPEYLRSAGGDSVEVFDYRNWHVPLGRRFRSLKLWFVIRHFGVEGLRRRIREHVALAQDFASWVEQDDRFELVMDPPLNLVCFRHRGGDEINRRILQTCNASGRLYLTHTRLRGQLVLRMSIGQTTTQRRHVAGAWEAIRSLL